MKIAVVDGQGGGIGRSLVEKLSKALGGRAEIIALGTNSLATSVMLKAGADEGATGENAVAFNAAGADVITGSIGIISANALLGELTPKMARAIAESGAVKVLIPLNRCNLMVAGVKSSPLPEVIDEAVAMIFELVKSEEARK